MMCGLLLGSSTVGVIMGRLTPVRAPGVTGPAAAVPSQAPVFSHCAMNCSSSVVASAAPGVDLKFWITYRRFCGVIFASIIFVFVGSSFHFATNSAIRRSSAIGPPAAAAAAPAAAAPPGATTVPAGLTAPGRVTPPIGGRTAPGTIPGAPICQAGAASALGITGSWTSSSGTGSGAPASFRCCSTSCRSTFMTSSFHWPCLK
mmetsp:Transcript_16379/g.49295  ORF Transcript_16379/g.49295 Transcript_16379/m.49295 type:complete len:203 (-) Transcript_16379:172-780(-)